MGALAGGFINKNIKNEREIHKQINDGAWKIYPATMVQIIQASNPPGWGGAEGEGEAKHSDNLII